MIDDSIFIIIFGFQLVKVFSNVSLCVYCVLKKCGRWRLDVRCRCQNNQISLICITHHLPYWLYAGTKTKTRETKWENQIFKYLQSNLLLVTVSNRFHHYVLTDRFLFSHFSFWKSTCISFEWVFAIIYLKRYNWFEHMFDTPASSI